MKIEIKLDFKQYLKLMYTLTYRKPWIIFLTILGLSMLVLSILYFSGNYLLFEETPIFQLSFGFFLVFYLPFSVFLSSKKNFQSHGRLQERISYEFNEDKIIISGESFNSEMDWTKTYKVLELKNWILLYQNRIVANVIPKQAFGENLNEFKELIRTKKIKAKLKK